MTYKKIFNFFFPSLVSNEVVQKVDDIIALINSYQKRLQDIKTNYLTYLEKLKNKLDYINLTLCSNL